VPGQPALASGIARCRERPGRAGTAVNGPCRGLDGWRRSWVSAVSEDRVHQKPMRLAAEFLLDIKSAY